MRLIGFGAIILLSLGSFGSKDALAAETTSTAPENQLQIQAPTESYQLFPEHSYKTLGVREGLPQSTVFAMAQGTDGLMYIGTDDGLAKFDGRRFESIDLPFLTERRVQQLIADPSSGIWVGTANHGLFHFRANRLVAIELPSKVKSIEALAWHAEHLWVGTPDGLYRCKDHTCQSIDAAKGLRVAELLFGSWQQDAVLWIGTAFEGLRRLEKLDDLQPTLSSFSLTKADGLPNNAVRSLMQWGGEANNDLWIGTGRGLVRWNAKILSKYDRNNGINTTIHALRLRKTQNYTSLLAGTYGEGLLEIKASGEWQRFGVHNGLPEGYVYTLWNAQHLSQTGPLWIGTSSSGLVREEAGRWRMFTESDGLPHRVVVGVGEQTWLDGSRSLWVGTVEGARRLQKGRFEAFFPPAISKRVVYAIAGNEQYTWFGTEQGLWQWDAKGQVRVWDLDNSVLPGLSILALRWDSKAKILWVASSHGLARLENQVLSRTVIGSDMDDHAAMDFVDGVNGNLLLATSNGLFDCTVSSCKPFVVPCAKSLNFSTVQRLDDIYWINSRAGVIRFAPTQSKEQRCQIFTAPELPTTLNFDLQALNTNDALIFGYKGATSLELLSKQGTKYRITNYGFDDGLNTLEFNRATHLDAEGRVWAATVGGLAMLQPPDELPAKDYDSGNSRSLLRWTEVSTEKGKAVVNGEKLHWRDSSLLFKFALLDFNAEHRHQFRFELTDVQTDIDFGSDNVRRISRIPPGSHQAKVWAKDAMGRIHGPLTFDFVVRTPLWRHPLAFVAYGLLLTGLGLAMGRYRAKTLRDRAKALENEVGLRTRELALANAELVRISTTDALTGLRNRRFLSESLPSRLDQAFKNKQDQAIEIHLLLIDLDHFKLINDTHGHAVGDQVLIEFAKRLREISYPDDWLIRWGGEEVLVLIETTRERQVLPYAQLILETMNRNPFVVGDLVLGVTCSIGVSELRIKPGQSKSKSFDIALEAADQMVYAAKSAGRNRVEVEKP